MGLTQKALKKAAGFVSAAFFNIDQLQSFVVEVFLLVDFPVLALDEQDFEVDLDLLESVLLFAIFVSLLMYFTCIV